MHNIKFLKTLTTGAMLASVAFVQNLSAQEATVQEGQDCGGNCTWRYDPSSQTLSFTGTGVINGYYNKDDFGPIKNLVIGEGITHVGYGSNIQFNSLGNVANSRLVLPSSMQYISINAFDDSRFKTIEISLKNMTYLEWPSIRNTGLNNLVLTPGENFAFPSDVALSGSFNVQCKGAIADCQKAIANISNKVLNLEHYKEYDTNNKLILEYSDTGYIKYDESGRILGEYSLNDKQLKSWDYAADGSVYTYDANHNLVGAKKTSPFTPAEAAALVKKGNHNTVTLTFK